ncbi:hypothetical protein ACFQYP_56270 [Nonomuraea antimicrobica]
MLLVDVRAGERLVLYAGHDHVRGAQVGQQGGNALRDQVFGLGAYEVLLGARLVHHLHAVMGLALGLHQPLVSGAGLAGQVLLRLTGLHELPTELGELPTCAHVEDHPARER